MVFYPWPSCNFPFTQVLFNVFWFFKNYNFLLDLHFVDIINGVLTMSSNFVADVQCWNWFLLLTLYLKTLPNSHNISWAILFDFLWRQSYHVEIMRIVYSFTSLLSFNIFFLVLCSRTPSIRLNRNDDSMPSWVASWF